MQQFHGSEQRSALQVDWRWLVSSTNTFTTRGELMGRVWIGTSDFRYPHWGKGVFYPKLLLPRDWLAYYSRYFDSVELNYTFYRLPTEETLS